LVVVAQLQAITWPKTAALALTLYLAALPQLAVAVDVTQITVGRAIMVVPVVVEVAVILHREVLELAGKATTAAVVAVVLLVALGREVVLLR
jgi:hypothetical protein